MGLRNWLAKAVGAGRSAARSWLRSWTDPVSAMFQPKGGFGEAPAAISGRDPEPDDLDESIFDDVNFPTSEAPTSTDFLGRDTIGESAQPPTASPEDQAIWGKEWHQMASSNVDEIRYLPEDRTLEVIFLNNYFYRYARVEPNVFLDFLTTSSPGRYVWNVLRARGYDYVRVGSGAIPIHPTGNVRRTANVVRLLLPEEIEAMQGRLERLRPGESFKKPPVRLRQADWRRENVYATPAQVRERRAQRRGKR